MQRVTSTAEEIDAAVELAARHLAYPALMRLAGVPGNLSGRELHACVPAHVVVLALVECVEELTAQRRELATLYREETERRERLEDAIRTVGLDATGPRPPYRLAEMAEPDDAEQT